MSLGYHKIGLGAGALTVLRSMIAPLTAAVTLFATTILYGVRWTDYYSGLLVISALLFFILLRPHAEDDLSSLDSGWTIVSHTIAAWLGVIVVLLLIGYGSKVSAIFSRRVLFTWVIVTLPLIIGFLILLRGWIRHLIVTSGTARSAVIAGVTGMSRKLARSIKNRPELGFKFVGFFDDRSAERLGDIQPGSLLGTLEDLPDYVKNAKIDTIFIAIPVNLLRRTKDLLTDLRDTTASTYLVPDIFVFDLIQARTTNLNGIPVVALCETPFNGWRGLAKRASDIILASLMVAVAIPVLLLIALAVQITSPGSIIFKQRRYGLDGQEILVYKFRTMTVSEDGDKIIQATHNDKRVTPIGRFLRRYSLDELPQLFNVLRGDMSVVGPRPHAVAHNEEYRKLIAGYMTRHKVAPGITGLAQISGYRGETLTVGDMEKRLHYDLEYLRQWSLGLDLKILLRTLTLWFRDEKVY